MCISMEAREQQTGIHAILFRLFNIEKCQKCHVRSMFDDLLVKQNSRQD
jgi:hypothetical protein